MVEEVFVRHDRVMRVRVNGREIATSNEHPFWVVGKGWQTAAQLRVGDRLLGADGLSVEVEGLVDADEWAVVYNLRILCVYLVAQSRRKRAK